MGFRKILSWPGQWMVLRRAVGAGNATRLMWQKYVQRAAILHFQRPSGPMYVNNDESAIFHIVHSLHKMQKLVDSLEGDCKVAVDVGGNNGWFSRLLKERYPAAKVYVLEPFEGLAAMIHKNLEGMGEYKLVQKAMTDVVGEKLPFFVNPDSLQTNSLMKSSVTPYETATAIQTDYVESITLDHLFSTLNTAQIDVLKVDVQGGEYKVLLGGKEALSHTRQALFEVSIFDVETNPDNVVEVLQLLMAHFRHRKVINPVSYGADVLFFD